jgi:hypothetical protein
MDDKSPNFVPVDLGLDIPDLTETKRLRRMPGGWSEGEAVQVSGFWKKRLSALEATFISRAFAARSAAKDRSP